jgi:hypothetical protein
VLKIDDKDSVRKKDSASCDAAASLRVWHGIDSYYIVTLNAIVHKSSPKMSMLDVSVITAVTSFVSYLHPDADCALKGQTAWSGF